MTVRQSQYKNISFMATLRSKRVGNNDQMQILKEDAENARPSEAVHHTLREYHQSRGTSTPLTLLYGSCQH